MSVPFKMKNDDTKKVGNTWEGCACKYCNVNDDKKLML